MDEFQVGVYVYFRGNGRSFRIVEVRPNGKLLLAIGTTSRREVDIVADDVTTASVQNLMIETQGFRPGARFRAVRARL